MSSAVTSFEGESSAMSGTENRRRILTLLSIRPTSEVVAVNFYILVASGALSRDCSLTCSRGALARRREIDFHLKWEAPPGITILTMRKEPRAHRHGLGWCAASEAVNTRRNGIGIMKTKRTLTIGPTVAAMATLVNPETSLPNFQLQWRCLPPEQFGKFAASAPPSRPNPTAQSE